MIKKNFNLINKIQNGFTLVELMVSIAVFTMVMTIGIGSLLISSDNANASNKLRTAVDNVNFAMESLTRELRTGSHFYCSDSVLNISNDTEVADCSSGGTIIAFKPQQVSGSQDRVAYKRVPRADGTYTLKKFEYKSPGPYVESEMVSSVIDIQTLNFYVRGSYLNDNIQPSVKILIKGVVNIKGSSVPFYIQSFASQRSSEI